MADYSNAILSWWRDNGTAFPAWALAARIVFAISPNSASCERVFALLKNLFGDTDEVVGFVKSRESSFKYKVKFKYKVTGSCRH